MKQGLFPPTINSEVLSTKERISEIRQMFNQHFQSGLEQARQIGLRLSLLKRQADEQGLDWLPIVEKIGRSERQTQKYIRIANNYALIEVHIRPGGADDPVYISINAADRLITAAEEAKPRFCSRACRLEGWPNDCAKCMKLNKQLVEKVETPAPVYPERFMPVAQWIPEWLKLAKAAKTLNKRLRKLEGSLPFRAVIKGRKPEYLSDKLVNVSRTLDSLVPEEPCQECDCNLEPNEDSDPCAACGGKGFLTAFDKRSKA